MFIFHTDVSDAGNNMTPLNVIVFVENVPSRPPVWIRPFASARFDEKLNQTFEIFATDGDRGIMTPICYEVKFEDDKNCNFFILLDDLFHELDFN